MVSTLRHLSFVSQSKHEAMQNMLSFLFDQNVSTTILIVAIYGELPEGYDMALPQNWVDNMRKQGLYINTALWVWDCNRNQPVNLAEAFLLKWLSLNLDERAEQFAKVKELVNNYANYYAENFEQ